MISLYDLIEASKGQLFGQPAAHLFEDFCLDATQAQPGHLFIALKSEIGDTHQHIQEAIENGATGVICNTPPTCNTQGVSVVLVRDTISALMAWSHYILGKFGTKVIGVTGSAGKSIAMDAIRSVLETQHSVHVGVTTDSTRLSVPLSLAQLRPRHKFVILKISGNLPGEMGELVQTIEPEVGVVTHIGDLQNARFGSPEEIIREKSVLVDFLSPSGLAVLNYDDDNVRSMSGRTRAEVRTVGMMTSFGPDMVAYNISIGPQGTGFDLKHGSERYVGQWTPLYGKYHLYSVMMALTVGLHYDIPLQESLQTVAQLKPLPGRMNPLIGSNDSMIIDDTYSANPGSAMAALDWLEAVKGKDSVGKVYFVLGDMENLGKNSHKSHIKVGKRAADVADVFITQGSEAALAARSALDHDMDINNVHATYATHDTIATLNTYELGANDIVLLKGGPGSRLEQVTRAILKDETDRAYLVRQEPTVDSTAGAQPARLSWVEIDTNALAKNVRTLKGQLNERTTLMAVVKADAYGHGAVQVARTAILNGAGYLGVSSMQEATDLREAAIQAPILAMNYTPPHMARQAIQQNVTLTVYDLAVARAYNHIARESNAKLPVHVKVDTGMGRLGVLPEEGVTLLRHLLNMEYLEVEGIYTHFSMAGEDDAYTEKQLKVFKDLLRDIQMVTGASFKYVHSANSAATIHNEETHFNMVRAGVSLYGMHPSDKVHVPEGCEPVLSWKTIVAQVKTLPPGHPVGYGNTYITQGEETVAVIAVGYGDGFRRAPNNAGEVLIHGQRVPIIGRVSMEKTIINVTNVPDVSIGDEVVLIGQQGDERITAEDVARQIGTINYEVTCSILPRVPRR